MKQQPKDHKITVRLNIDGEEYWGFADKERETAEEQAVEALAGAFARLKAGDA